MFIGKIQDVHESNILQTVRTRDTWTSHKEKVETCWDTCQAQVLIKAGRNFYILEVKFAHQLRSNVCIRPGAESPRSHSLTFIPK